MVVELGIALDVLVGMLIFGVFFFQIREQFDSLDLQHLEKLKRPGMMNEMRRWSSALPLAGAVLLALVGHRRLRRRSSTSRRAWPRSSPRRRSPPASSRAGRSSRLDRAVLRRSVQRVPGRADRVRRLHDVAVLPALHADRAGARQAHAGAAAALPQHVPALQLHDAAGAAHQQHGHPVGGDGGGHARDRAAGLAVPHAGLARGGVEVLHPVRRRHRAGAVRHDPALLRRREGARRRGRRAAVDPARPGQGQLEPTVLSLAFVFLLVGYGTKVGLVPLHNWLPDAHAEGPTPVSAVLSGLLLNVALYAVVRCKVLVDGALAHRDRRRPDDGLRPAVGRRRGVLAVAAEGHQAPVRLLVDRAHGDRHVRVRHGRPGRELRRAAAHDRPFAHQVRDLLRRRPRRAEDGHADDGRHPRPDHDQPRWSAGG